MIDNEPKPKNKFNLWEYTANDELRPALNGVFHDPVHKVAVATNAHILVADSASFDEKSVDKNSVNWSGMRPVDKYGNFIPAKFPNYARILEKSDGYESFTIEIDEIAALIAKHKAWLKTNGYTSKSEYVPQCVYKIKDTYFDIYLLHKFLKATNGNIEVNTQNDKGIYLSETRSAIMMPIFVSEPKLQKIDGMLLTGVD